MDRNEYFDQLAELDALEAEVVSPEDQAAALELRSELAEQRRIDRATALGALGVVYADGTTSSVEEVHRAIASGHTIGTHNAGAHSSAK